MGYLTRGATAGGKTYDLLPCPHCGGEAEFRDGSSTAPYIRCKSCGCRTGSSRSYEKLVESWNRRAERACRDIGGREETPAFKCSECGCELDLEGIGYEPTVWVNATAAHPSYCPKCGARVVDK